MSNKILICLALCVAVSHAQRYEMLGTHGDICADISQAGVTGPGQANCRNHYPPSAVTAYLPVNPQAGFSASLLKTGVSEHDAPTVPLTLALARAGAQSCETANIDTGAVLARTTRTAAGAVVIPAAWLTPAMQVETEGRLLCIHTVGVVGDAITTDFKWTGIRVAAVFQCSTDAQCSGRTALAADNNFAGIANLASISAEVAKRTTCCAGTAATPDASTPASGICIDPRTTNCCGGRGMFKGGEKCCQATTQTVRNEDDHCPCVTNNDCTPGTQCCRASKFGEFSGLQLQGRCFGGTDRCCDTGAVYDPETMQCCVVSGLQRIDVPCPCGSDADCVGGQAAAYPNTALTSGRCCMAFNPAIREETKCSKFTNTPSYYQNNLIDVDSIPTQDRQIPGQLLPMTNDQDQMNLQRCPGRCIDTDYQICCNAAICHQEYEKCCNSTCCNKFTSHCAEGMVMGSRRSVCSRQLNLDPIRAFMVFALPSFLLVSTLLALALALALSQTVTSRVYSYIEIGLMLVAALTILAAVPSFFSPAYKYGVVVVLAALLAFLAGTSRTLWLNALALAAIGVALLYLFNPFGSSVLYDLSSIRDNAGDRDSAGSGLMQTLWSDNNGERCSRWYAGYFMDDMNLKDMRFENPADRHFGYCSRAWTTVVTIVEALLLGLLILLFSITALALVLRFRKVSFDSVPGL